MADQFLNAIQQQQGYYTPPSEEEQRNRVQRDKLMMMGAAMLANSSKRVNPLQAIGQGLMVGMNAGQESEQQIQQEMTRGYANEALVRKSRAERALAGALPSLVQGGWAPDVVKQTIASNPDAGAAIVEMAQKRLKEQAELDKTAAETRDKRSATDLKIAEKFANRANYLSKWSGLTPDATQKFVQEMDAAGVSHILPKLPFQSWANPDEARKNFAEAASMFNDVKDQISQAETGRSNKAREDNQTATLAQTIARDIASNEVARSNLDVARGNLDLSRKNADRLQFQQGPNGEPITFNPRGGVVAPAVGPDGATVKFAPRVPEAQKKELMSIDQQLATIAGARNAAKETPSAFGFWRGMATKLGDVSETLANKNSSSDEVMARSYVFNIVSKVINERAGAAQSAQELARLRGFLPAEMDGPKQIQDKLDGFERYLRDLREGTTMPHTKNVTVDY